MLTMMGWKSWNEFNERYIKRYKRITRYLKSHGKTTLEAFFTFTPDMTKHLGSVPAAVVFYSDYLHSLPADCVTQKASALINIAGWQATENSELGALSLDESLALYSEDQNQTGQMICEFHQIRLFQLKTHGPSDCLAQTLSLADRFLQKGNHHFYYLATNHALRIVVNDTSLLAQFSPLKEKLCDQLREVHDEFNVMRLDILEAYDSSKHQVSADQARLWFEQLLKDHSERLTPLQLSDVYHGLYNSYSALTEPEEASKYAQKYFDLVMKMEDFTLRERSRARHTLAVSRVAILRRYKPHQSSRLDDEEDWDRYSAYQKMHKDIAFEEVAGLEPWIQIDTKSHFEDLLREKRATLSDVFDFLRQNFPDVMEDDSLVRSSRQLAEMMASSDQSVKIDVGDLLRLAKEGRGRDGIRLANDALERVLNDPVACIKQRSDAYYVCAVSYDIAAFLDKTTSLSAQEVDDNLALQIRYLRKQRDLCQAVGDHHSLLRSVHPFQRFMQLYIIRHPELEPELVTETEHYFQGAERAAEMYRRSVLGSHAIATLLRMQKVVSAGLTRMLYAVATSFYIDRKDAPMAWTWAQKGRARALFSILTRQPTSSDLLISALGNDAETCDLLASDNALLKEMQQSTAMEQLRARTALQSASGRRRLLAVPALEKLLGAPVTADTFGFAEAAAVYEHVKSWLSPGKNVVLVHWVVEPSGWICLMAMDCRERNLQARARLKLRFSQIQAWIDNNLVFPQGATKPLESERPLKELTVLVEALAFMSKPEDLLVLSPPAELAAVPLHAIPLGLGEPVLIQRNPVVYASSFSLYLECLRRVEPRNSLPDKPLSGAVFAAAYEEPDRREERQLIFEQMEQLGNEFDARQILGHKLTATSFKEALGSSPWVHYHGHACYDASEVLNQCFILSDGEELPVPLKALALDDSFPRSSEQAEEPVQPPESNPGHGHRDLLSTLLDGSSRLNVSDIFAMNLRKNKPFVCSIACDSGVQDVNAGDEPLGLVTALFCAGASSVLGTLWPMESSIGRMFTALFYESLVKQIDEVRRDDAYFVGVLNVARATREAILALKKDEEEPISWAGFVLHGAGFYSVG